MAARGLPRRGAAQTQPLSSHAGSSAAVVSVHEFMDDPRATLMSFTRTAVANPAFFARWIFFAQRNAGVSGQTAKSVRTTAVMQTRFGVTNVEVLVGMTMAFLRAEMYVARDDRSRSRRGCVGATRCGPCAATEARSPSSFCTIRPCAIAVVDVCAGRVVISQVAPS
jgi:hypothetical protein